MTIAALNAEFRVLIVVGEISVRNRIKSTLMHLGFARIMEANSAKAALKHLAAHEFNIVVCSLVLPDSNGIVFFQQVRTMPSHDQLPFLFVTTSVDGKENEQDWPHLPRCEFARSDVSEKELRARLVRLFGHDIPEESGIPPCEGATPVQHSPLSSVSLLTKAAEEFPPPATAINFPGFEKLRLLLVDPNEEARSALKLNLRDLGFKHFLEADTGSTALRRMESGQVDFVLTEWILPGMSGYELARAARRSEITSGIPLVVLTANTAKEEVLRALRARVDDYLVKPTFSDTLIEMFNRILPKNEELRAQGNSYKGICLDDEKAIECARTLVSNAFHLNKTGAEELGKIRILLVDQDEHFRRICGALLRRMGFNRIMETGSGISALKKLENGLVDIVFCDWFIEPVRGLEILQSIRSISFLKTIPFIMLTDTCSQETVIAALRSGVSDYIAKPCNVETLAEGLAQILASPKPATADTSIGSSYCV
ncbi:MAG: response regulator [Bdellovibrionota bacterium]